MSATASDQNAPTVTATAFGDTARGKRIVAYCVIAAGGLFIIAAIVVGVVCTFLVRRERNERARWLPGEATIIGMRSGQFITVPDPEDPTGVSVEWQVQPQLDLGFELEGQAVRAWADVPMSGWATADEELGHYSVGESIRCWLDSYDALTVRLAISDGGRRTGIVGGLMAFALLMPGIGFIFAGWLLRRFVR